MAGIIKDIGAQEFETSVIEEKGLVLVDFWAPWCGPCRVVGPVLEEIAQSMTGLVTILKVNVDNNHELARTYGISGIPTMLLFKDGQVIERSVGAVPKASIEALIRKHI